MAHFAAAASLSEWLMCLSQPLLIKSNVFANDTHCYDLPANVFTSGYYSGLEESMMFRVHLLKAGVSFRRFDNFLSVDELESAVGCVRTAKKFLFTFISSKKTGLYSFYDGHIAVSV